MLRFGTLRAVEVKKKKKVYCKLLAIVADICFAVKSNLNVFLPSTDL